MFARLTAAETTTGGGAGPCRPLPRHLQPASSAVRNDGLAATTAASSALPPASAQQQQQ
jgi:hypothetical protein